MHKGARWKLGWVVLVMALGTAAAQQKAEQTPRAPAEAGEAPAFGTINSVGVDRFAIKKMDGSSQTILVDELRERGRSPGLADVGAILVIALPGANTLRLPSGP